jgi:hypothetical protein
VRIPIKLHKQVALLQTVDAETAEEILARKSLARFIVGRLSPTVLLIDPQEDEFVLDELRKLGHAPRVVS